MKTTVEVSVHKPYEDIDEDKDKQNSAHRANPRHLLTMLRRRSHLLTKIRK